MRIVKEWFGEKSDTSLKAKVLQLNGSCYIDKLLVDEHSGVQHTYF